MMAVGPDSDSMYGDQECITLQCARLLVFMVLLVLRRYMHLAARAQKDGMPCVLAVKYTWVQVYQTLHAAIVLITTHFTPLKQVKCHYHRQKWHFDPISCRALVTEQGTACAAASR